MTVLAVSITTRSGKPLLSRQYQDINRDRIMELLSNFQNLVANSSRQHTFVEEDHVRYVYKPFDDYYIILITNRQSNIIQDMDTLNLFSQTVNSNLKGFSEEDMLDSAFDILSSFDEIISLGYKENLSLSQINTFLSMESHEEKIQEIIERGKEYEAAEERKRRAIEIARKEAKRKMAIASQGMANFDQPVFHSAKDPNMDNAYNSYYSNASAAAQQSYKNLKQQQHMADASLSGGHHNSDSYSRNSLKLGGKKGIHAPSMSSRAGNTSRPDITIPKAEEEVRVNNGILVSIRETINVKFTRDGSISTSELKGVLELRINKSDLARTRIVLDQSLDVRDRSLQFKTHPNVDKNLFMSSKVIGLKDSNKPFPSNDQNLGVLRWRKVGAVDDDSFVPLHVSTWVSPGSEGTFEVTVEFENNGSYKETLRDLRFVFPIYTQNVSLKDDGEGQTSVIESVDEDHGVVVKVDAIEPGASGVFCISAEAQSEDALFPMNVVFAHSDISASFAKVGVSRVVAASDEEQDLPFDAVTILATDEYVVD